jgi:amino acid transporter
VGERGKKVAAAAITFELVGVLVVGTLSLIESSWFPRATVWSGFGIGYALIPFILPIVGLWWLRRERISGGSTNNIAR